jgi:hypothetical protein
MARHRNNPSMAFWRMIKEGNDHFEATKAEPHVDVCEKRYVFDAHAPANASAPLTFHAREKCPAYEVPEAIASAVRAKETSDERAFAEYANRGVSTVAVKTGADGGMHPAFLAKLQSKSPFDFHNVSSDVKAPPGPLPANVNPPHAPEPQITAAAFASPAAPDAPPGESPSTLRTIGRWFGLGSSEPAVTAAAAPAAAKTKPTPSAAAPRTSVPKPSPRPHTDIAQAPAPAPPTPTPAAFSQAAPQHEAPPQAAPAPPPAQITAPVVPANSFEGRWDAIR